MTDTAATPAGMWNDDPASLLRATADHYTTRADTMRRRAGLIDLQNEAKEAADRAR